MFAFGAPTADFTYLQFQTRDEGVEKCGFAHTGMAAKQGCSARHEGAHSIQPISAQRADGMNGIASRLINLFQFSQELCGDGIVKVYFVEENCCGDVVGLGGDK